LDNLIVKIKTTQHKEIPTMRKDMQKQEIGLPEIGMSLDDVIRRGARQVIQQAIEAELAQLLEQYENVKTVSAIFNPPATSRPPRSGTLTG
jgi:hypothetical protein